MIRRTIDWLIKRRRINFLMISAILLLLVAFTGTIPVSGKLDGFYVKNNPYTAAYHKIEDFYPYPFIVQVQVTPENCSTATFMNGLELLEKNLNTEFPVSKIRSLTGAKDFINFKFSNDSSIFTILNYLQEIPLLQQLVSEDHHQILLLFYLKNADDFNLKRFSDILNFKYPGIQRTIAISQFHIENQIEKSIREDLIKISFLIFVFLTVSLLFIFRKVAALALFAINAVFSLIPLFFLLGICNIPFNMITVTAIPLVLILSLCDSAHLLNGFFQASFISDKTERIKYTIDRYMIPSFFTSFTTAIAFLSFLLNDSSHIKEFGLISGIAIMLEFFITFLTFPWLMQFLPPVFIRNELLHKTSTSLLKLSKSGGMVLTGILVVSLFFIQDLKFKTDFQSFFPLKTELRRNHQEMKENFQSLLGLDILIEKKDTTLVDTGIKQMTVDLVKELSQIPEVKHIYSYKDQVDFMRKYLGGLPLLSADQADDIYILDNRSLIRVAVTHPEEIRNIKAKFDRIITQYQNDFSFTLFSPALLFDFINEHVAKSLMRSMLSSGFLIMLVFLLFTRNFRNTMVSMLANLVPLGSLVLLFVIFSIEVNITTALTAVICLGLIVDDTIHILYRKLVLQEELNELNIGVLATSILLTGGFLLFTQSNFLPTRIFGILSASVFLIAVLSDIQILDWLLVARKSGKGGDLV
jgi:uncharacterized protein